MRQHIWRQVEGNQVSPAGFGDTHPKTGKKWSSLAEEKVAQVSPPPIGKKTAATPAACFYPSFLRSRRNTLATLGDTGDTRTATHAELPQTRASIGFPLIPCFTAISSQSRRQGSIAQNGGKSIMLQVSPVSPFGFCGRSCFFLHAIRITHFWSKK